MLGTRATRSITKLTSFSLMLPKTDLTSGFQALSIFSPSIPVGLFTNTTSDEDFGYDEGVCWEEILRNRVYYAVD